MTRDLAAAGRKVLLDIVQRHYGGSRARMARERGIPQTTLNDYARTGKGGLRTLSLICSRDSLFFNAFIQYLAGEPNEDASWNRIARDLREILSIQEALDMVDSCQTLADYESASNAVKVLRQAAALAEGSYRSGRKRPLSSVESPKSPEKPGS